MKKLIKRIFQAILSVKTVFSADVIIGCFMVTLLAYTLFSVVDNLNNQKVKSTPVAMIVSNYIYPDVDLGLVENKDLILNHCLTNNMSGDLYLGEGYFLRLLNGVPAFGRYKSQEFISVKVEANKFKLIESMITMEEFEKSFKDFCRSVEK